MSIAGTSVASTIALDEFPQLLCKLCEKPSIEILDQIDKRIQDFSFYFFRNRYPNIHHDLSNLQVRIGSSAKISLKDRIDCLGIRNKIVHFQFGFEITTNVRLKIRELRKRCLDLLNLERGSDEYREKLYAIEQYIVENEVYVCFLDEKDLWFFGQLIDKLSTSLIYRSFVMGHYDLVKLLACSGADLFVFGHLISISSTSENSKKEQTECIKVLIENGLELKNLIINLAPPDQVQLVQALIAVGIDANRALENLVKADIKYPLGVLQALLDAGAQVTEQMTMFLFCWGNFPESMERLRCLIFNAAPVNILQLEYWRKEETELLSQSLKRQEALQCFLAKCSMKFPALYKSLQTRANVLQEMQKEQKNRLQEELSKINAFSIANPREIMGIVSDYCVSPLTVEEVAQDPVLRKHMLEKALILEMEVTIISH